MSIFDLVGRKFAIECKTEEDARLVVDTAIANGIACNWNEDDDTGFDIYEACVCCSFEQSRRRRTCNMYRAGADWAGESGYELIAPENIDELGIVCEEIKPSSYDVFTLIL